MTVRFNAMSAAVPRGHTRDQPSPMREVLRAEDRATFDDADLHDQGVYICECARVLVYTVCMCHCLRAIVCVRAGAREYDCGRMCAVCVAQSLSPSLPTCIPACQTVYQSRPLSYISF